MKALLLDIDDTVYAVVPCHEEGLQQASAVARKMVRDWDSRKKFERDYVSAREEVHHLIPDTAASHCRLLYAKRMLEKREVPDLLENARKIHDAYWLGYFSQMELDPDCLKTINSAIRRGVRVCFVSNLTTERQILKLKKLGLENVGWLVTSEEAGKDKPALEPFELAIKKLGVSFSECVFVGDDERADIIPAKQLGMRPIWLQRKKPSGAPRTSEIQICSNWGEVGACLSKRREAA